MNASSISGKRQIKTALLILAVLVFLLWSVENGFSQTIPINYATTRCSSQTTGQVYLMALGQVSYPTCLAKGPTLKVTLSGTQGMIDVDSDKVLAAIMPILSSTLPQVLVPLIVPLLPAALPQGVYSPTIQANSYFTTGTVEATPTKPASVQLFPGPDFNRYLKTYPADPPLTSDSKCNVAVDGASHLAYEFTPAGGMIVTGDFIYVCTLGGTWKRTPLSTF